MSAVGTAVSPSPDLCLPCFSFRPQDSSALFQTRFIRISSQTRRLMPPRVFELIIRFPFVVLRSVFACSNAITRITSLSNGHYVITRY